MTIRALPPSSSSSMSCEIRRRSKRSSTTMSSSRRSHYATSDDDDDEYDDAGGPSSMLQYWSSSSCGWRYAMIGIPIRHCRSTTNDMTAAWKMSSSMTIGPSPWIFDAISSFVVVVVRRRRRDVCAMCLSVVFVLRFLCGVAMSCVFVRVCESDELARVILTPSCRLLACDGSSRQQRAVNESPTLNSIKHIEFNSRFGRRRFFGHRPTLAVSTMVCRAPEHAAASADACLGGEFASRQLSFGPIVDHR